MHFFRFYAVTFVGVLPNTLLSYEERNKWDHQVLTMPFTRKQLVTEKYLVGLLLQVAILSLSALAALLRDVTHGSLSWPSFWLEMGIGLVLSQAGTCLMLPVTFRNGAEKGRMAYSISFGVLIGIGFGLAAIASKLNEAGIVPDASWLLSLIAVVLVLMPPASWALSVRWYEKREF